MQAGEKLAKVLAHAGVASRRRAEEMIRAGRVRVNGALVRDPAVRVVPKEVEVRVDGRPLSGPEKRVYLLVYKPAGYVSTVRDPQGRPRVVDLVAPRFPQRLYPVGRLDLDTEGLMLLTNDGELAHRLTHPRFEVPKTYQVLVRGRPGPQALGALARGVELEDGRTAPARVRVLAFKGPHTLLELTLHEGKKRQVKRLLAAVGHPVQALKRTRLAFLTLRGLGPGRYRELTPAEVARLAALGRGGPSPSSGA